MCNGAKRGKWHESGVKIGYVFPSNWLRRQPLRQNLMAVHNIILGGCLRIVSIETDSERQK